MVFLFAVYLRRFWFATSSLKFGMTHALDRLWQAGLQEYDELMGMDWQWQSLDGVRTKAWIARRRDRSHSHRSRQTGDQAQ